MLFLVTKYDEENVHLIFDYAVYRSLHSKIGSETNSILLEATRTITKIVCKNYNQNNSQIIKTNPSPSSIIGAFAVKQGSFYMMF